MPQQGTSNEYHNTCLCGEIGKIAILSVDKLAISVAVFLAKYFSYLSMKTFFKRNASMRFSAISATGGSLYHSWLIQQTTTWWYFSYVPQKFWHFMQIVSIDNDLHEMSSSFFFWKKIYPNYSTVLNLDEKHAFVSLDMFDIQYLIKEWLYTCAILYPCIKHILKQSMQNCDRLGLSEMG